MNFKLIVKMKIETETRNRKLDQHKMNREKKIRMETIKGNWNGYRESKPRLELP